jgi:hypothetical protein
MRAEHAIKIRDLRPTFGAPEVFAAHCSCGWTGEQHHGRTGNRSAVWDGRRHLDSQRPARSLNPVRVTTTQPVLLSRTTVSVQRALRVW